MSSNISVLKIPISSVGTGTSSFITARQELLAHDPRVQGSSHCPASQQDARSSSQSPALPLRFFYVESHSCYRAKSWGHGVWFHFHLSLGVRWLPVLCSYEVPLSLITHVYPQKMLPLLAITWEGLSSKQKNWAQPVSKYSVFEHKAGTGSLLFFSCWLSIN